MYVRNRKYTYCLGKKTLFCKFYKVNKKLLFWLGERARKPEVYLWYIEDFRSEIQQRPKAIIYSRKEEK